MAYPRPYTTASVLAPASLAAGGAAATVFGTWPDVTLMQPVAIALILAAAGLALLGQHARQIFDGAMLAIIAVLALLPLPSLLSAAAATALPAFWMHQRFVLPREGMPLRLMRQTAIKQLVAAALLGVVFGLPLWLGRAAAPLFDVVFLPVLDGRLALPDVAIGMTLLAAVAAAAESWGRPSLLRPGSVVALAAAVAAIGYRGDPQLALSWIALGGGALVLVLVIDWMMRRHFDNWTGLPRMGDLVRHVEGRVSPGAVALLSLESADDIADQFGAATTEQALRFVGFRLRDLREAEAVRLEGPHFAILFRRPDEISAHRVINKVRSEVQRYPFRVRRVMRPNDPSHQEAQEKRGRFKFHGETLTLSLSLEALVLEPDGGQVREALADLRHGKASAASPQDGPAQGGVTLAP